VPGVVKEADGVRTRRFQLRCEFVKGSQQFCAGLSMSLAHVPRVDRSAQKKPPAVCRG